MSKKVCLQPTWTMHALQHQMFAYPPTGYEFVVSNKLREEVFRVAAHCDIPRFLLRSSDFILPTRLVKSWIEKRSNPPPENVLTYTVDHLVFRPEPWVIEVECAGLIAGGHVKHFQRFKHVIERSLNSSYCRKILCWSEAGRKSLIMDLDVHGFQHKIDVVHLAVPPKYFVKKYGKRKVKLLFVGSSVSKETFEGRAVGIFEVFSLLRQQYSNLELVVHSNVPNYAKADYARTEGLKIIDKHISPKELEEEYLSADIFIIPSYGTVPFTMLEAMSYELPVVTIDFWANAEYIEDGKTGLVAPRSKKIPYYYDNTFQPGFLSSQFKQSIRRPDPEVISELVKRVSLLIENQELRKNLGKAARWEVENGRFSLIKMNEKLKRIFDEAIEK